MPGLKALDDQIREKEKEKKEIIKQIKRLREKRESLIKFRRLIWTKGTPLENIVRLGNELKVTKYIGVDK